LSGPSPPCKGGLRCRHVPPPPGSRPRSPARESSDATTRLTTPDFTSRRGLRCLHMSALRGLWAIGIKKGLAALTMQLVLCSWTLKPRSPLTWVSLTVTRLSIGVWSELSNFSPSLGPTYHMRSSRSFSTSMNFVSFILLL
jgi:hypothetical protein